MNIRGVKDIGAGEPIKGVGQGGDPSSLEVADSNIQTDKVYTKEEVAREIQHLNKWFESRQSHLKFVLHEKLNEYYVQVIDNDTNEVLREIPPKKIMDIVASFYEKLGFIVDEKI
jgi:flagellar protein FlaG